MKEEINNKTTYSLLDLAQSLENMFEQKWSRFYWVRAEINKLSYYPKSGHAYPELVEKVGNTVKVEMRGTIWKSDFDRIQHKFRTELKEELQDGIKILCYARLKYQAKYGLSLEIKDIDPIFTKGDLDREKEETLMKLKKLGILFQNKSLRLPLLPQRLAIISVETSKGYSDFLHVLNKAKQQFTYAFFYHLFPAVLQGEKAVVEIVQQLHLIQKVQRHFDAVLIIRGGGGDIGLSCYNHFDLSKAIAEFPLPVFTGIGHSTNTTVAEIISHTNAITPTELADALIQHFHNFSVPVEEARKRIPFLSRQLLEREKNAFEQLTKNFRWSTREALQEWKEILERWSRRMSVAAQSKVLKESQNLLRQIWRIDPAQKSILKLKSADIQSMEKELFKLSNELLDGEKDEIKQLAKLLSAFDPKQVLRRGFSITRANGKAVMDANQLEKGQLLTTELFTGQVESEVNKTSNTDE
jgi:exodeoxyribonuclease VII large subunit